MASSATSATSFELIEDQTLTVEEVEMASQEAQDIRTREAAVAAGLVLDEPEAPPSASATDVMKDLSSALERLRVAFAATHEETVKVMYLQMAFKQRPLRDGGGKPSLGRLAPWTRPLSKAAAMGAKICVLTSPWRDKLQESLSLGDGSHPFPEDLLEDIREILAPGAGRPAEGQPFFLDILHSLALNIQDTIRNQTVERTTAPTVLDGVQALHWLHAAAEEGPPSQGAPGREKEVAKPPPEGWQWPEPGTRWVLLKADVTKAHQKVKVLRKDWRFEVA